MFNSIRAVVPPKRTFAIRAAVVCGPVVLAYLLASPILWLVVLLVNIAILAAAAGTLISCAGGAVWAYALAIRWAWKQ